MASRGRRFRRPVDSSPSRSTVRYFRVPHRVPGTPPRPRLGPAARRTGLWEAYPRIRPVPPVLPSPRVFSLGERVRRLAVPECGGRAPRRRSAIVTHVRVKGSDNAAEVFVTAISETSRPADEQAELLYTAVADVLRRENARLLIERAFGTDDALSHAADARKAALADLDDGVPPVLLSVPEGPNGPLSAVQAHAIRTDEPCNILTEDNKPCGRILGANGLGYVALSGLTAPEAGANVDQAQAIFTRAANVLRRLGSSMQSVARTWLWLGNILDWYDDFNTARNQFFTECGLIDTSGTDRRLPASTGIGIGPTGPAACALDVVAMIGQEASVECYHAAGMQQCAYEYGSAFSRVSRAKTPAGASVYVSGTAAIDEAGVTVHVGDARGQIDMTVENVRACLRDMDCPDTEVVQAIAYSKTPEIQALFDREYAPRIPWPCISVISDVCRDDLLFEIEAMGCPGAKPA